MNEINKYGKAKALTVREINLLRNSFDSNWIRITFEIGLYTAERWGAIAKLETQSVFTGNENEVREKIIFPYHSRKQSAGKRAETREVTVHPNLRSQLENWGRPKTFYLFPSPQNPLKPRCFRNFQYALEKAVKKAGLTGKKITTHSTRRTAITFLAKENISTKTIQAFTGHKSIRSLAEYIEVSEQEINKAIAVIP